MVEGITDPEEKRKRIGHEFIRVFEEESSASAPSTIWPRAPCIPT
jgi:GMP synthase (glutamine-hydrolysing)